MKEIEQLALGISSSQATWNQLKWEENYHIEQLQVVRKQIEKVENSSDHIATIKKDRWNTLYGKIDDDTWIKYKGENLMFEDSKAAAFKSMTLLLEAAKEQEAELMKALSGIRADMRNYRKACALLGQEVLEELLTEEVKVDGNKEVEDNDNEEV